MRKIYIYHSLYSMYISLRSHKASETQLEIAEEIATLVMGLIYYAYFLYQTLGLSYILHTAQFSFINSSLTQICKQLSQSNTNRTKQKKSSGNSFFFVEARYFQKKKYRVFIALVRNKYFYASPFLTNLWNYRKQT